MPTTSVTLYLDGDEEGVEVDIEYEVGRADPDVGYMYDYCEDWWLVGNDDATKALQDKLNADKKEYERIEDILHELANEDTHDYDDYDDRY